MNAGELSTRTVVFALAGNTVYHAAELMRRFDVGNVVVVREKFGRRRPIGIVTDRDIAIKVVAFGLDARQLDVDEVMVPDVVTVDEQMPIEEAAQVMRRRGVRRAPVVDERGGLVGILSFDDIVELVAEEMSHLAGLVRRQQARLNARLIGTSPEEEIPPPS